MSQRLVILTQYYPPETGAPQTRLSELAKGLQQRGWEIEVITALPNYPHGRILEQYRGKWRVKEVISGIPTIRYWLYASNSAKSFPRIVSMLSFSLTALQALPRLWRFKPDYLLVESPPLTLGVTGWLLSLMSKPRMIFNVSDIWPYTAKELGAMSDGWFYHLLERLESFLYRRAFACTGQSDEIVTHIQQRGGRQVLLFRNGVDVSRFSGNETKQASSLNKKVPKLVYTGLLGVAQGITRICQEIDFSSLGVEFHIYGAGAERQRLEQFIIENPNRGIVYHGSVNSSEIPGILQHYDAALIALAKPIYGAVPSKIYEAMAAGLPIFFSGEGEGRRIIEQHQVGWVNSSGDYAQLASNFQAFTTAQIPITQYAQNCRQVARTHFSRQAQIDHLDKFLNDNL